MSLQPDPQMSVDFLRQFHPEGPWVLHSIAVKGSAPDKAVFHPGQEEDLARWIRHRNRERNLYFSVNLPTLEWLEDPKRVKAKEVDIAKVRYLHVDLDPRKCQELPEGEQRDFHGREREGLRGVLTDNLPAGVPEPTIIVDSGGGYWGFWRLEKPIELDGTQEKANEAKLYSKQLQQTLGPSADSCHNVDRIARLPGTVNWSGAKLGEKGQVDRLATCERFVPLDAHPLGRFKKATGTVQREDVDIAVNTANVVRFATVDTIPELQEPSDSRNAKCRVCIEKGHDPDDPPKTRSEPLLFVCCQMIRAGCEDDAIYSVITDPAFGISASVLDKGSGIEAYAVRQIKSAHKKVAIEAEDFQKDNNEKPYANLHNVRLAIAKLGVTLEYDEFADRALISGLSEFGPYLDDAAVTRLWLAVEESFQLPYPKDRFWAIVSDTARQNRSHPVREFLGGLSWDGKARLDGWLSRYLGVEESEYTHAIGTIVLIAAVRRVRQPGCKFDEMMVLEGPQGGMKSTALAVLAMRPEWFSDDLPLNAKAQQFIEQTVGKWIVEAGELEGMRKGDVEALKSCLSRQRDRARMSYARLAIERDRQLVIVGTTNKSRYLKDSTGGRRFWPVRVGDVDLTSLRRDVAQLWAEATAREAAGASIRLDPALYGAAAEEQEARHVEDPWVQVMGDLLGDLEGKIRSADAWGLVGVPIDRRTQHDNDRLGEAMRKLGWERKKLRFGGPPEHCYAKGDASRRLVIVVNSHGVPRVCPEGEAAEDDDVF